MYIICARFLESIELSLDDPYKWCFYGLMGEKRLIRLIIGKTGFEFFQYVFVDNLRYEWKYSILL